MAKEYNPTKPFNEQTRATIEETWKNAEKWGLSIRWAGKRAAYQERLNADVYKIDATDGIGTKALLHWMMYKNKGRSLQYASEDAIAMVFDDFVEQGARPYRMQDHIVMQEEDEKAIYDLTRGLADLCKVHGAVITGGETAICDTIRGFEMGITAVGVVEKGKPRVSQVKDGDAIISLRSSGIHSNGLTFARKVFGLGMEADDDAIKYGMNADFSGINVGEELTKTTTIYCKELLELLEKEKENVHGLVHVTGGGWTKLKEMDQTKKFDFLVNGNKQCPHEIFWKLKKRGELSSSDMYKKFNCGTGYFVAVDAERAWETMQILNYHSPVWIGNVKCGSGRVKISSAFHPACKEEEVIY